MLPLLIALVAAAPTSIVPQKSIAGVQLGMSQAQVRSVLGTPASTKTGSYREVGHEVSTEPP